MRRLLSRFKKPQGQDQEQNGVADDYRFVLRTGGNVYMSVYDQVGLTCPKEPQVNTLTSTNALLGVQFQTMLEQHGLQIKACERALRKLKSEREAARTPHDKNLVGQRLREAYAKLQMHCRCVSQIETLRANMDMSVTNAQQLVFMNMTTQMAQSAMSHTMSENVNLEDIAEQQEQAQELQDRPCPCAPTRRRWTLDAQRAGKLQPRLWVWFRGHSGVGVWVWIGVWRRYRNCWRCETRAL
jgi:hypothetical protein